LTFSRPSSGEPHRSSSLVFNLTVIQNIYHCDLEISFTLFTLSTVLSCFFSLNLPLLVFIVTVLSGNIDMWIIDRLVGTPCPRYCSWSPHPRHADPIASHFGHSKSSYGITLCRFHQRSASTSSLLGSTSSGLQCRRTL